MTDLVAAVREPVRRVSRGVSTKQPATKVVITVLAAVCFAVAALALPTGVPPVLYLLAAPMVLAGGAVIARGPRWCLALLLGCALLGLFQYSIPAGPVEVRVTDFAYAGLLGWVLTLRGRAGRRISRPVGQLSIAIFLAVLGLSLAPFLLQAPGDFVTLFVSWLRLVQTVSLVWLVPYAVRNAADRRFVLGTIAFFCGAEIVRGLFELVVFGELGGRLRGGNGPNPTGLLAALLLVMAVHAPVPERRELRFLMGVLGAVGLVLTQSIGSISATGLALGVYGLRPKSSVWQSGAEVLIRPARMLLLGVGVLGLAVMIKPENLPDSPDFGDSSTAHRLVLGGAGFELFLDSPVTGVGWQRSSRGEVIGSEDLTQRLRARFDYANRAFFPDESRGGVHNAYVQTLAETGLVGFTMLVAMLLAVRKRVRELMQSLSRDPQALLYVRAVLVLVVVALVWWNDNALYGGQPETVLAATFIGLLASFGVVRAGAARSGAEGREPVAAYVGIRGAVTGRSLFTGSHVRGPLLRVPGASDFRPPTRPERRKRPRGEPTGHRPQVVVVGNMPEPIGGVEEHCYEVCAELFKLGVAVHFLDTERHPRKRLPRLASYSIVTRRYLHAVPLVTGGPGLMSAYMRTLPRVFRTVGLRRSVSCLLMAARIADVTRRSGARHIVVHHAGQRGLAALVAARATDARLTVFTHGSEWSAKGWAQFRPVARLVASAADRVIANSDHTAELCRKGSASRSVEVISPGVRHTVFSPDPGGSDGDHDRLTVLFVGRMDANKGSTVLARAIPMVRAPVPVRFVFVGPDRGAEDPTREIIRSLGVEDRVDIRGYVPHDELPRLYREADVFVFPTTYKAEGFGLVAAEAMACGTPVVASRVGAVPEVVLDGRTGLLFTAGDATDLAVKLSSLLNDQELRARLGAAGVQHVARYEWSAIARALLRDLIA